MAQRLKDRLPLPILDSVAPAIGQAETLAALAPSLARTLGRLAACDPPTGISPALAAHLDALR